MNLKEAAEVVVATRIGIIVENRRKMLSGIAKKIVEERDPKIEVNLPELRTDIVVPTPIVNIPQHPITIETIIEDRRTDNLEPLPINVTLVVPPDSINVVVNPVINVPSIELPQVNVSVPEIKIPTTVVNVTVPEMPPPVIEVKIPPEPKRKDPPTAAVVEHTDGSKSFVELK